ncbi:hypothetical protein C476_04158 [Natrinema limicola JCM 13563]|uniref:Ester cyclase n=2 Tax=Natrinema limicola TaxID=370323 RepID=M0CSF7_9EURY|nr:hypothetical protein C476_04158 [Natrinema limicola JCM 13563]
MNVIDEGDKIVLQYTMAGTNGPSLLPEEPTSKPWEGSRITICRFEDEKIIEQWITSTTSM